MTCLPWGRGYQDEDIPEDPGDSGAAGVPVQFRAALADVLGAMQPVEERNLGRPGSSAAVTAAGRFIELSRTAG